MPERPLQDKRLVQYELNNLKATLVNRILLVIIIAGLPTLIITIISSVHTGFYPYVSTIAYVTMLFLFINVKKASFTLKIYSILIFGFLIGTRGLLNEGLMSDGFLFYFLVCILASIFLDLRAGIVAIILCFISSVVISLLYHFEVRAIEFDASAYMQKLTVWLSIALVLILLTVLNLILFNRINGFLLDKIEKLTYNQLQLNEAKDRIEEEMELSRVMQSKLAQSEQKLHHIFNTLHEGILIFDHRNIITDANQAFYTMTRFNASILMNYRIPDILVGYKGKTEGQPDAYQNIAFSGDDFLKTSRLSVTIPVQLTVLPFYNKGSFLMTLRDISLQKEAEKQVLNAIIQTEERERTRFSQDLHDSLGPLLSAAKLYSAAIPKATGEEKRKELTGQIVSLIDESIRTVKEVSGNLSSHVLKSFGLKEAVESFTEKIAASHEIDINLQFIPTTGIAENVQIVLYRVIVELINNTIKYALARSVEISLNVSGQKITLRYTDDGQGFDAEKALAEKHGLGLVNIQSRIKSLGGTYSIDSTSGKGTRVIIVI